MTGRRLGPLRWWGLAGTGLLAVGGFLAGARPGAAPASLAEALWGTGPGFRVGLAAYLAGLVLLGWAWWMLGRRLRAGTGPAPRWMLVTGALWAAPLLVAPPLGSRDLYAYACQGAVWLDGHDPYQVGALGGGCPWWEAVPDLWHDSPAPYGPLALVGSAGAVGLARLVAGGEAAQLVVALAVLRLVAVAGAVLVAGFGPRLARACGVDPAAGAWLGLVTPLVAVHVVSGAHNDALVAGLLVAALALLSVPLSAPVSAPVSAPLSAPRVGGVAGAGVMLGLAVAVKVTAVAAVPFAVLLAMGAGARWAGVRRAGVRRAGVRRAGVRGAGVGLVVGGVVVGFGGMTVVSGLGTGWTGALASTGSLVQWSSLPTGLGMAAGYALWGLGAPDAYQTAVGVARGTGLAGLVVLSAAVLLWAWRRRAEPGAVVAGAGVVLAAVVVLGPVVYPWYAVTPLAVLAASTRGPARRRWLAVATLVLTALVLPSGLGVPVLTKFPGAMAVGLGFVAGVVLLSRWWWRGRPTRPEPERPVPVR